MDLPPWIHRPAAATAAASAAIAAQPREPHKRAPAPWRRVRARVAKAADDVDGFGYDAGDELGAARSARPGCGTSYAERMKKKHDAFAQCRARATSDLIASAPAAVGFREDVRLAVEAKLQELIDWAAERHCCYARGLTEQVPKVVHRNPMTVQDVTMCYRVTVPRLLCSACGEWDVQAEECGCFPASPVDPKLWLMTSAAPSWFGMACARGVSRRRNPC